MIVGLLFIALIVLGIAMVLFPQAREDAYRELCEWWEERPWRQEKVVEIKREEGETIDELQALKKDPGNYVPCGICGKPVSRADALWVYDNEDGPPVPVCMCHAKPVGQ